MANFFTDNPHLQFQLSHPLMQRIITLKEDYFKEKDEFDFAPKDFEDALDSYTQVLEIIGEISGDVIAQNAESVDHDGPLLKDGGVAYAKGTQENIDAIIKGGLMGITLPRKYDGLNFSTVPFIMGGEIVARADGGFANIWGLQD
ncbi:MAG: hypothetical protein NDI80_07210, partial [Flavobacteriaceae bacterium]|nr:hypothetical protein [Flavobacteriaceae bacterium]